MRTIRLALALVALAPAASHAACPGATFSSTVVDYFGPFELPGSATLDDLRCTAVDDAGVALCHIVLRGTLHKPASIDAGTRLPGLVYSLGNAKDVGAETAACSFASAVVPLGYQ